MVLWCPGPPVAMLGEEWCCCSCWLGPPLSAYILSSWCRMSYWSDRELCWYSSYMFSSGGCCLGVYPS